MFERHTVRLTPALFQQATEAAARAGYSSLDEFVSHLIEKELARQVSPDSREAKAEIAKQLKGLGYLE